MSLFDENICDNCTIRLRGHMTPTQPDPDWHIPLRFCSEECKEDYNKRCNSLPKT